ncbi:MAG: hypothetical protein AAFY27_11655, partial [Pseudomonadota bacterium]
MFYYAHGRVGVSGNARRHRAVRAFEFNPRQYISHPAAETMSLQSPLFSAKEPARKAAARKVRLSEADAIDVWI